jgi:cytoskeletal protein RodZ
MGLGEEAGKVATSVLDVMRAQPLVLGLLLVIFALIGLLYFQSAQFNDQRSENVKLFMQVQGEVQRLLSQCIIPPPPLSTNPNK